MKLQKIKGAATYWVKLTFLSKEIKATFFTSLFFILLIEFLKEIPACYHFIYVSGYIFLNVCYSVFAASIFFIVVSHLPSEKRNITSGRFFQSKLVAISNELGFLLVDIGVYNHYGSTTKIKDALHKKKFKTP